MELKKIIYIGIFTIFSCLTVTDAAKILGVFTSNSKSHLIIHMSVVKALVERGHNVTVVTTLPINEPNTGYRHIKLNHDDYREQIKEMIAVNGTIAHIRHFFKTINLFLKSASLVVNDTKVQKIMKEDTFDLLLLGYFLNDFQLGLAAHFKCPVVMIWTGQSFNIINNFIGNPSELSHVPNIFLGVSKNMTFFDRTKNFLFWIIEQIGVLIKDHIMKSYYEENFPIDKYPSFEQIKSNVSLVLCNHHFSEGPIRADVPGHIEIGGIQIKPKPNPLPSDIKKILDDASKNGAIFFSLGSNVQSADLQPNTIDIIYKTLSNLKQKVLWKWEDDNTRPGNASNIYFNKWMPQDDILAHPNIRLFVTHGGKGSVVESKFHAVPMIGLPMFADQFMNIKGIETDGYGRGLNIKEMTVNSFRQTIEEVLVNPKYKDNLKRYADLYRDRPMSARDTATFWIEYVIRHRGAPHIQSPAIYLNTIQYLMLDVAVFLGVIIYIWYKLSAIVLKFIWNKICCRNEKIASKKNKKEKKM